MQNCHLFNVYSYDGGDLMYAQNACEFYQA